MTHITEARVIGSHADMRPSQPKPDVPLSISDMREETADESTWDSEGGAFEYVALHSR
jgi:hypothetical protein